jgi:hypothetical protein
MKNTSRYLAGALLLAAPFAVVLFAQDPPTPTTGHVLLLNGERTLEGDIERQDNQYRVRRSVGEIWVPADNVLYLGKNLEDVYGYLRSCANLRDADERLRLARWCQLHGMRGQALAEATAAVELNPHSPECQRLQQTLQRTATVKMPPASAGAPRTKLQVPPPPPTIEVGAETMGLFRSRVQPILMNTCAECHIAEHGGSFHLTRAVQEGLINHRATQQNLVAVLAQINKDKWESSPFLLKAVSVHGGAAQPPLKNRQASTYRSLEDWVKNAVANSQEPQDTAASTFVAQATPAAKATAEPKTPKAETGSGEPVSTSKPAVPADARPASTPPSAPPNSASQPAAAKEPVDPYDPVIFNRETRAGK